MYLSIFLRTYTLTGNKYWTYNTRNHFFSLLINQYNVIKEPQWAQVKNFGNEQKKLFLVETCYFLNEQKCFYPNTGLLTLVNLKAAKCGTWTVKSTPTCALWALAPTY